MKGASPTTGRAQSTAWPKPNGAGCRMYTQEAQLGRMPRERVEQLLLALRLQHGLEFGIRVEMILDGALRTAGDEHQRVGAR